MLICGAPQHFEPLKLYYLTFLLLLFWRAPLGVCSAIFDIAYVKPVLREPVSNAGNRRRLTSVSKLVRVTWQPAPEKCPEMPALETGRE